MSITISLSPNTESEDVRQAWRTLFTPHTWRKQEKIDVLSKELSTIFNYRYVSLVSSGRRALYDILRAYDIGSGDEVILQAFTCIAVPASIKWAEAKPVYADIHPQSYNIDPASIREKITDKTKAIVVQHTFGIPADITTIRDIARTNNLILIEDCAHALGATHKGQPVGTFGDVSFVSFGRDKPLSSVFGGAVISEDQAVIKKIQKVQESLSYPSFYWVKQQLLHPIAFSVINPLYFTFSIGKVLLVGMQKMKLLSKAVAPEEKIGSKPNHFHYRFSPALASLLSLQLNKLQVFTQRRKYIANRYLEELRDLDISMPVIYSNSEPSWLRFPIQVNNSQEILNQAKEEEMLLGDWYRSTLAPSDVDEVIFEYPAHSCPKAEKISQSVINLPTYPTMSDKDVDQVIEFMKSNIPIKSIS